MEISVETLYEDTGAISFFSSVYVLALRGYEHG